MLPEEITNLVGKSGQVRIFKVEEGAIKRLAEAVGDQNPLYWDEEYARNSRYRSIIAPPGFFGWPTTWTNEALPSFAISGELIATLAKAGYNGILDGGIEYEFFCPVRAGDTLVASSMIKHISERTGRTGKVAFMITETTYTNQNDDLVARVEQTSVHG